MAIVIVGICALLVGLLVGYLVGRRNGENPARRELRELRRSTVSRAANQAENPSVRTANPGDGAAGI
jgi:membrane protein DedA with SNARE-associated domain